LKILFFIENLWTGGTQRRLLELIAYLKQHTKYEIALVLTEDEIHFEKVYELGITIKVIKRRGIKYDPKLFLKFYRYCRLFKPDIIHTWGIMTAFYSIPAKLICRVPLITSMIADLNIIFKKFSLNNFFFNINLLFSDVILSNSKAGLQAYNINSTKAKVIYNGACPERFHQHFDKRKIREEIGVKTDYIVIMVASFSKYKDYDLFVDVAKGIGKIRDDTTFIGIGDGSEWNRIQQRIKDEQINNILLTGKQKEVEHFIAASDIGLLCTYSEGISNSIIEYMSLGKPVISTDINGGSKEIVIEGETGYCTGRNTKKVVTVINFLLNDEKFRESMGNKGRERINSHFSFDKFGNEFEIVYKEVLARKR
jgi:glycosyltransferase involved in cell wall biosynthesis